MHLDDDSKGKTKPSSVIEGGSTLLESETKYKKCRSFIGCGVILSSNCGRSMRIDLNARWICHPLPRLPVSRSNLLFDHHKKLISRSPMPPEVISSSDVFHSLFVERMTKHPDNINTKTQEAIFSYIVFMVSYVTMSRITFFTPQNPCNRSPFCFKPPNSTAEPINLVL